MIDSERLAAKVPCRWGPPERRARQHLGSNREFVYAQAHLRTVSTVRVVMLVPKVR